MRNGERLSFEFCSKTPKNLSKVFKYRYTVVKGFLFENFVKCSKSYDFSSTRYWYSEFLMLWGILLSLLLLLLKGLPKAVIILIGFKSKSRKMNPVLINVCFSCSVFQIFLIYLLYVVMTIIVYFGRISCIRGIFGTQSNIYDRTFLRNR